MSASYLKRDVADVGQVADIDTFALAQKLLCARTAGILSLSKVARDLGLSVNTVKRYVSLLTLSFQCHLLRPYSEPRIMPVGSVAIGSARTE